ncbi:MAG: hypothetical protein IJB49_07320 [Clostridia bacterium]|nr:hypothetical protein [Clostridia bacterium]
MKKLSFILCLALLLPVFCIFASASGYGAPTQKLIITHVNVNYAGYEGTGVIYTKSDDGTIAQYGSFDWWNAVSFQWSSANKCFEVIEVKTEMGSSKGYMKIPENVFFYCCNVVNEYPALYKSDPTTYAAYADANAYPDYTTPAVSDSCSYAASLKSGDKVYLYGADLLNATVSTNGKVWYKEDFKSDAFIKIGEKESGSTAYSPETATEQEPVIKLGINAINGAVNEGQAMLLTPSYGDTISVKGNNYGWCRVAVFDWSEKDDAYVLVSINDSVGNNVAKNAVIPKNGFAVSVNTGNDYPALGIPNKPNYVNETAKFFYNTIPSLEIGTKVYLEGIDLAKNTFEYEGNISKYYSSEFTTKAFIKICETKPEGCYEPDKSKIIPAPEFDSEEKLHTVSDVTVSWKASEGAKEYYVAVYDSTVNTNGTALVSTKTTETSVTLSADDLTVGSKYTVNVYAIGENGASVMAVRDFIVCSERALDSQFRDMKIVAFGDSITAWKGWVSMLYGELGCEVINSGVGGDTTVHALKRIDKDVIAHDPDLVIVNFGMNDQAVDTSSGKNLTPIDQYEANYRTIIEKIQETGSKIILVAVHDVCDSKYGGGAPAYNLKDDEGVGYVDRYNEVVKRLAEEYKLGFLDINTLAEDKLETIILDGIHLNTEGQAHYCKWISDYCFEYIANAEDVSSESPEASEDSNAENESNVPVDANGGMTPGQIAITAAIMFVVISVIGVMFIKIVIKNKKKI